MVIVFDLDDTLYNEKDFVLSGFSEVANWISYESKKSFDEILQAMIEDFNLNGRGAIFDNILKKYHKLTKKNTRKCISIYRLHSPKICLTDETKNLLLKLKNKYKLYIVTDGNKIVQKNKVQALNLNNYFEKIFITYRYGIKSSKPSLKCFEIIKNTEKINWNELVYIGDNPNKDFVNLNKVNAITIRILKGDFANLKVDKKFDAKYKISNLNQLSELFKFKI